MLDQATVGRRDTVPANAPRDHLVHFYEERADLVDRVVAFAAEGVAEGAAVLLVATQEHIAAARARMGTAWENVVSLDATETLAKFCDEGVIDRSAFVTVIGGLLRDASANGRPVRVFGEMVALLWNEGHVLAALALEELWCDLGHEASFTLLCAYPADLLLDLRSDEPVVKVCRLHSHGQIGSGHGTGSFLHAFPGLLAAVAEARQFVTSALRTTDKDLLYDARLIVSELASNAVQHARTPFLVEVVQTDAAIRIAVRDGEPGLPELKAITLEGDAGRGMALIEALSTRWGIDTHERGKTVWAEISPSRR